MPRLKPLARSTPSQVGTVLKRIGMDLKTARLRRRLSQLEVATRLGVDRRSVAALEAGSPRSAMGIMAGAMWLYGIEGRLKDLVHPNTDEVGQAIEDRERPKVARKRKLDDDF